MIQIGLMKDLRVVMSLVRGNRGINSGENLNRFYASQADHYDAFREKLLHGRRDLIRSLSPAKGEYWIEMGGGTGRNLEYLGVDIHWLSRVDIVDLCDPLLDIARSRFADTPSVRIVAVDAEQYLPEQQADAILFSYSLSMMDRWREVLNHAIRILKPGGRLGVVDYFVSHPVPADGRISHSVFTRNFWPRWFSHDGVRISPDLPDFLLQSLEGSELNEHRGRVPLMAGLRVPYFVFTGYKPKESIV